MTRTEALTTYINFARLMVERDRRIYRFQMSKLQNFAARAPKILADLEKRADALDPQLTKLETTGHETFDRWKNHIDETGKAIAQAQDAINALSNGGPPLDDSFREPGAGAGA